ncbi:unnamed protein product [Knipowitschia caucasica]|uniref:Endothelin-like toxin domain-containing protein n=1 Tax=Knipowitschia caucasica TaxID=637954 RepID=A0AAV2K3G9_KNICA
MARFYYQTMLVIVIVALHEGCGVPLSSLSLPASLVQPKTHTRVKRCSCDNWEDKECLYYCHLDIIWINTPSKLVPYGLGSSASRHRRSPQRCQCFDRADHACSNFCHNSSEENATTKLEFTKSSDNKLLQSLRSVIMSNSKKLSSREPRTKSRQQLTSTIR